jgi:hypothetical protein
MKWEDTLCGWGGRLHGFSRQAVQAHGRVRADAVLDDGMTPVQGIDPLHLM